MIDSTAIYNQRRRSFLSTEAGGLHFDGELDRYLVILDVKRPELKRRAVETGRDPSSLDTFTSYWEEPDFVQALDLNDPRLLRFPNHAEP